MNGMAIARKVSDVRDYWNYGDLMENDSLQGQSNPSDDQTKDAHAASSWNFHEKSSLDVNSLSSLFSGKLPKHESEIVPGLKKLAKFGLTKAFTTLGLLYKLGIGGARQSFKSAFHWYKLGADKGDSNAQAAIAGMYKDGEGVEQSILKPFTMPNYRLIRGIS